MGGEKVSSIIRGKRMKIFTTICQRMKYLQDLFNGAVFSGNPGNKPEYLEEMNEKKQLKVPGRDGQPAVIKKLRDVQKGVHLGEGDSEF